MVRKEIGFVASTIFVLFLITSCESLKPGECKKDRDCSGQVKGLGACYKEPPDAELGKCMTIKQAKSASNKYKKKLSGKCEDKDGDGVKAGEACDPPVDCDDGDPKVKPGATEVCDLKDNNCDGVINENQKKCVGTVLGGKQEPVVQFMPTMPAGVEVAPNGDVLVTDQHRIYRIDQKNNKAVRMAGSNKPGHDDKKGKFATFDKPRGLAIASDGTVFVAECNNNCVRKLAPDGQVSVYAGKCSNATNDTGLDEVGNWEVARFWCPIDIAFDKDGSLLVVDMLNSKIKRISKDRKVSLVAGRGGKEDDEGYVVFGFSNGPALKAEFNEPAGISVGSDGTVYIADMKNNCIRTLKKGKAGTLAGACDPKKKGHKDGPLAEALFNQPNSVELAADGTVWVTDTHNHVIRKIKDGKVSTISGKAGQQGYYDGDVKDALYNGPQSIAVAKDGTLYVVDLGNYRVRLVNP
jgi:sugar lactone lactonase YvrE